MDKYLQLLNTDSLALIALAGLVITVLVTLVIFAFLLTRKNQPVRKG